MSQRKPTQAEHANSAKKDPSKAQGLNPKPSCYEVTVIISTPLGRSGYAKKTFPTP